MTYLAKVGRELTVGLRDDLARTARGFRWGRRPLIPRSAEQFAPPPESSQFPSAWSRTVPARVVREVLQTAGLKPVLRAAVEVSVEGLDIFSELPSPVIFVGNHTSHLDSPLVLCTLPDAWRRRTAVAAAADYFFDTWWRATSSCLLFNVFPIERRSGALSSTPADLLAGGWNMLIFPEGTRSNDGWAQSFKLGAAFIAIHSQVPVVPVALRGTYAAMPRGRNWPVPGWRAVTVRYGRPLYATQGESIRDFGPRIEAALAQLRDEDASNWYAAARRAAQGTSPALTGPAAAPWRRRWAATDRATVPGGDTRHQVWS
jgi:1-acyl-sn-glycerol-3-phosphate acyltransferase